MIAALWGYVTTNTGYGPPWVTMLASYLGGAILRELWDNRHAGKGAS